jgi:hypothetical protein
MNFHEEQFSRSVQFYTPSQKKRNIRDRMRFKLDCEDLEEEGVKIMKNQKASSLMVVEKLENLKTLNVMVVGRTQSGKTGVILSIIKESIEPLDIPIKNIFVITGLSDVEWEKQTKQRLPAIIKDQVFHRGNFHKFKEAILDDNGVMKQNILIIIDEIQIACLKNNSMSKAFQELGFFNKNFLFLNNIKIVQFSATPDGNFPDIEKWKEHSQVVYYEPGNSYVSSFSLLRQGRLRQYKPLCKQDEDEKTDVKENILEIKVAIMSNYTSNGLTALYHIIRTKNGDYNDNTIENFREAFGKSVDYITYDQESDIIDVNDTLSKAPKRHTFIFIKEKLRCAKTLNKRYLGICYERYANRANDSSILQGLIGRLTGYDDNGWSICYTNIDSVERYEQLWNSRFNSDIKWISNSTKYIHNKTISKQTYNHVKNYEDFKDFSDYDIDEKDNDFEYRVFDDQDDAIKFMKSELNYNAKRRSGIAPENLMQDGDNPSVEYIVKRKTALNQKNKVRMVPTNENRWCVYWRPSFFE